MLVLRKLQFRIALVFLGLLLLVLSLSYWLINADIQRSASASLQTELNSGQKLLARWPSSGLLPPTPNSSVISTLTQLRDISGLQLALIEQQGGTWRVIQATLSEDTHAGLIQALPKGLTADASEDKHIDLAPLRLADQAYASRIVFLPQAGPARAVVLLSSLDEALAPYRDLRRTLLIAAVFSVVVFGVGSVVTARRITRPLRVLAGSARRLGRGDYEAAVLLKARDEIGDLAQAFETMRQAIQQRETEIRRLAYRDALTDLPNREQFRNDLRLAVAHWVHSRQACAILILDLDRFKHVNDVLGHRFGDRLLQQVAHRLRAEALSSSDVLARLGGDEFAVLLHDADAKAAQKVSLRIQHAFERPLILDEHTVDLGAGIGVASCPEHGHDADALMNRAEVAMYAAKQQQTGNVTYHAGLDSTSEETLTLLGELRQAVDHNQLRLYLQPKVSLITGQVVGAEALVRWQHPQRGVVLPLRFIPFAEQTGFVRTVTSWMIERCAVAWRELRAQHMPMKISINLSTRDLMDQDLPQKLQDMLALHAVEASALVLEITESAIMDDPQRALQTLERLHQMGLKLSIDDFGTGYSSLAYLKRLPVDELKIDRSFVMNMETEIQDAKIVRSTIDLAHNLGLSVVAEGVESTKSWRLLTSLQCDEAQGYLISRPIPQEQFAAWVRSWVPPQPQDEPLGTQFSALL